MIWLTATSVSAVFLSLVVIVMQKWILARQIDAATVVDALQAPTIKTSTVRVPSAMLEDCVTKTSMNVNFLRRLAETAPPVRTLMAHINVCALKDTKAKIVQSTLTTALLSLVKTGERVLMASEITLACATKVSKESIVKVTSTSVYLNPA